MIIYSECGASEKQSHLIREVSANGADITGEGQYFGEFPRTVSKERRSGPGPRNDLDFNP